MQKDEITDHIQKILHFNKVVQQRTTEYSLIYR